MFIPLSDIRKWLQEYHFPIYPYLVFFSPYVQSIFLLRESFQAG